MCLSVAVYNDWRRSIWQASQKNPSWGPVESQAWTGQWLLLDILNTWQQTMNNPTLASIQMQLQVHDLLGVYKLRQWCLETMKDWKRRRKKWTVKFCELATRSQVIGTWYSTNSLDVERCFVQLWQCHVYLSSTMDLPCHVPVTVLIWSVS